jgi:hypothetical protein
VFYANGVSAVCVKGKERNSLIDLIDEPWPVSYRAGHEADMNEVERLRIHPLLLNIVNLKLDIWWHPVTNLVHGI